MKNKLFYIDTRNIYIYILNYYKTFICHTQTIYTNNMANIILYDQYTFNLGKKINLLTKQ